nr:hypothetical protein [Tanacetum cinerariifolium]
MAYLCLYFTRNHEDLKSNTLYLEDSIRHIKDYLKILEDIERDPYSKKLPVRRINLNQYGISIEAEKSRRRGQEFNWETATYGKVMYFKDINYFKDFENEFPAIVYKDALTSESKVPSEPTVSAHHIKKVVFILRYHLTYLMRKITRFHTIKTILFYKLVSVNDLKLDSDNDVDKIDIKQSLRDISVKPLPDVISTGDISVKPLPDVISIDTQGSNKF